MRAHTVEALLSALALFLLAGACNRSSAPDAAAANLAPAGQSQAAPADPYGQPATVSANYAGEYRPLDVASEPPPPLPDYTQPECPGPNYIWTPGYWSYTAAGYYWVPGAWVLAPYVDALWTPPYWAYSDGHYRWHRGYWGRHVGFYGGINYGFGYTGLGYDGGY